MEQEHSRPFHDLASRASRDLVTLAQQLARRFAAGERAWIDVEGVELKLTVPFRKGDPEAVAASILGQMQDALEEAYLARASYVRGRVHCFRCGTSACAHAVPPERKAVFVQYAKTGAPVWEEFAQACLRRGDGSAAALYGDTPAIVAHYDAGEALRREQMAEFGRDSNAYRVLGQVTAGYLPLWNEALKGPDRAAVTYHAVESRWGAKGFKVDLNPVGPFPKVVSGERQEWLDFTLMSLEKQTREHLSRISRDAQDPGAEAAPALHKLRASLEKLFRRERRRTDHANEHARWSERPTGKAVEDARMALPHEILRDARTGAAIVLGPALRVHVFGAGGRHVTSATYSKDAIERKKGLKIWVPLRPGEAEEVKRGIEDAAE